MDSREGDISEIYAKIYALLGENHFQSWPRRVEITLWRETVVVYAVLHS